jgi:hypothetical protein
MWQTSAMGNRKVCSAFGRAVALAVVFVERQRSLSLAANNYFLFTQIIIGGGTAKLIIVVHTKVKIKLNGRKRTYKT